MRRFITMAALAALTTCQLYSQEARVELDKSKVINEANIGDASTLVDEQRSIIGPPAGAPSTSWRIGGQYNSKFPISIHLDLGKEKNLSNLWLFDTNGSGDIVISAGKPGDWKEVTTYDCKQYKKWACIPLEVSSRYIRITKKTPGSNFTEIAVYEYTPEAWAAVQKRKAEEAAREAARQAALKKAMEEMKKRPLIDLGSPFGKCYLVDEVNCATQSPAAESPTGISKVEDILGKKCRVIPKTKGEGAYFTYLIGKMKMLQPGASYILQIEYPEDKPRTVIVSNTANEMIRGFHTGGTMGDAFHPKYVNNRCESINTPLTGKYEDWQLLFRLHDRFTEYNGLPRGGKPRPRTPEQGFYVTIAQYSAKNIPLSQGAAVSRIRLFAVPEPEKLYQKINYPAKGLPRRRLFWREEMADGVVGEGKKRPPETRGVVNFLDWYKNKAKRMKFLGMNTFTKDMLEFGACQGWDTTPHGGNKWAYFSSDVKHWWGEIVDLMGKEGFDVFPYYEYSGSKGQQGLGFQRRCRPLTDRPGNYYTHIKWVERATADITDPDTYEDFKKMLDLTVVRMKGKANFAGIWLRPRGQIPVSFADATLKRFNAETKQSKPVTRKMLIDNKELYNSYIEWWGTKRRDFLAAMRQYLMDNGIKNPTVLLTGEAGEPGVGFDSWDPVMVTDNVSKWAEILKQPEHLAGENQIKPLSIEQVVQNSMYMKGLLSPGLDWGGHEVRHARPGDDPHHYKNADGLMLSHCFNRLYTVASPETFDAYRTKTGLTLIRHYSLNENMMFDKADKAKLGYFVNDMEKAGPYCMMAEAVAMANGDPTMIGYLSGGNYGRGFPEYVRNFNAAFLSLPALPSVRLPKAASDPAVVVREIKTPKNGTYYSVVSTSMTDKKNVTVTLPAKGKMVDSATGKPVQADGGKLTLSFYPYQLRTFHVK